MYKNELFDIIDKRIDLEPFIKISISDPLKKDCEFFKITVIPHKKNDKLFFQFSMFFEKKVKHENFFTLMEVKTKLYEFIEVGYQQWDLVFSNKIVKILYNKRGTHKVIVKEAKSAVKEIETHDKSKKYFFKEGVFVDWMFHLGIMNKDGKVFSDKQRKFRQINKFIETVSDVVKHLPKSPFIIDYGCGKSYLTFALYSYLHSIDKTPYILGIDLKQDVVETCNALADKLKFMNLDFLCCDMKEFKLNKYGFVDMIVSLHACDTLTDYVLSDAISNNVSVILSVPCCHHEVYTKIKNDNLNILLKHGILKERFSSLMTDSIRNEILEINNYKSQLIEFIDKEDTPKNIMIRAHKKINLNKLLQSDKDIEKLERLQKLKDLLNQFNISQSLFNLLYENKIN